MTTASAKKRIVRAALCLLVLAIALIPAVLATSCSKATVTTTTAPPSDTTVSTAAPETSTTATSVAETTTTVSSFPPTLSHEQTDSRFAFAGSWSTVKATQASGGSLMVANSSGASLTVRFYGTAASWVAKKSPAYGKATVTVDGGAAKTVDLYSSSTVWKKKVWQSGALTLGDHTVVIQWTGDKSTGATAANINVDAVVVTGVLTGTVEQDASKIKYAGTWTKQSSSAASGGSYVVVDKLAASVTVKFSGTRLVWIARTSPDYGQAKVTVDGADTKTVDLYATSTKTKQPVFDTGVLTLGTHTVKITWAGTKVAASKGTSITVDAFVVTGSLQ